MNIKELCLDLARIDDEKEIVERLKKAKLWDEKEYWVPFGNMENNFSTIGNQQSSPDSALVEKLINSVDALLISKCLENDIDPSSDSAPQSIDEAVSNYFSVPSGRLSNLDARTRTELADNIHLVASGDKTYPSYSIIDRGEGQHPHKFIDTFLSLNKSNKLRIPFVQGKFNMGGTGVLQFAGERNLQLLISKRMPKPGINNENKWGFTIVRREYGEKGVKNSTYKFLAPNDEILSFYSDSLPLIPDTFPNKMGKPLEFGTFIKLYNYDMKGYRTNILFDLYNRLSLLMPNLALPIRLSERRNYKGHSLETTLSGLTVRLEEDKNSNLEPNFPASASINVRSNKLPISIYAFKKDLENKKSMSEKYTKNEGILFSVNGQSHGFLSNQFFTRKKVGHSYISDSILVVVDCSNLDNRLREDLFMNSRDKLRDKDIRYEIEDALEMILSEHPGLKALRESRRNEAVKNKIQDNKPLADVLNNIMKKSPTLSKIFLNGDSIRSPFNLSGHEKEETYVGERFPSFFKLAKPYSKENPKECEIKRKFRVQFKTDAENDYFTRDRDSGSFSLTHKGKEIENYSINLWNGYATINCELPENIIAGDILKFEYEVDDVNRFEPITGSFFVHVNEYKKRKSGKGGGRKKPPSDEEGKDVLGNSNLALPNVIPVEKADWDEHGFDEYSALKIQDAGDGSYDYFINIDNSNLLYEIKNTPRSDAQLLKNKFKYANVLIGISILNDYNNNKLKIKDESFDIFDLIQSISRSVSPMILPMIESLGELSIDEL